MALKEWPAALPKMTSAAAVIFDFRGYPWLTFDILGHLSRSPMMQQRWYAPVITHPDRSRWEFDITERATVQPREPYIPGRKVFLTDGRAISFADSWMAMVAYYRLAQVRHGSVEFGNL
jgi:hypothetical protein